MASSPKDFKLEIVSHCWNYSKLLTYQLSSIVLSPPKQAELTFTVFYNEEDEPTVKVLEYFRDIRVDGVNWRWWPLEKHMLFRRTIGRNLAALATEADWIWFTDCDVMFRENCIDWLAEQLPLQSSDLVYPRYTLGTELMEPDAPALVRVQDGPSVVDIDPSEFHVMELERATGYAQIARGDVVRKIGYCNEHPKCLRPSFKWVRTRGDVVFRRDLGTEGVPLEIPGVYRNRHRHKGRRLFSWGRWRL